MTKVDLKRELRALYGPTAKEVTRVDIPSMNFLMIDGEGDPNTAATAASGCCSKSTRARRS